MLWRLRARLNRSSRQSPWMAWRHGPTTPTWFTSSYNDNAWDLVIIILGCSKKPGTTTGEDLVRSIDGFLKDHDLKGHVAGGVTDCGLSMVKASLVFTESRVFKHVRHTHHRLESTNGPVFNEAEVKCTALSRALASRYTCCFPAGSTACRVLYGARYHLCKGAPGLRNMAVVDAGPL